MKRSDRGGHGHSSIKRIKSQEDSLEECTKPIQLYTSKTSPTTGKRKPKLPPGFGFSEDTVQFNRAKGTRRANNKRGCKKYIQTKARKMSLHLDVSGEADRNLETDTLDLTPENDVEKKDETDNAGLNVGQANALQIPRDRLAQTYPPSRKSSWNNLESDDLETDLIIPEKIHERQLARPPSPVAKDYCNMIPKDINEPLVRLDCIRVDILVRKQRPEDESTVQIHHVHKGLELHDEFGARLKTFKTKTPEGKEYYRHIFYDVETGAPAEEMKLRNNNEMVLLNGVFVPDLTHDQVINLFRDVKVDGETRFQLVIRYVDKKVHKTRWVWFQTSAILSPEEHHRGRGVKHPSVEDERFRILPDNEQEMESTCRFRVKGTKYFVAIENNQVGVSLKPYDIRVTDRYKQDKTGTVIFTASLRANRTNNYIAVSGKNIVIQHTPFWFHMSQISADYAFTCEDKYLAFDARKKRLTTATGKTKYMFQKIPIDGDGLDEIDAAVAGPSTSDATDGVMAGEVSVHVTGPSNSDKTVGKDDAEDTVRGLFTSGATGDIEAHGATVAGPSTCDVAEQMEHEEDITPAPYTAASNTAEQMDHDHHTASVAGATDGEAAERIEPDQHTTDVEESVNQHSKLVFTSSQNTDADSFHPMSQCSSLSDIQYADEYASASMTSSSESMTSSSQSSQDDTGLESSGYLTSGSLDMSGTHDVGLSIFENNPKTPNTPMACLSMNDALTTNLTS